ncbi:phosphatidylserine decarboxylase [Proteiniborus sp. DW1]|uniref:phosphatidylserine decarboxylase n=1 Tax=Proteiniborus sp. DW1 TaxID=1889883 RepID=UPI00092E14AD|nr:phosphatidylserine decarboxylase [Proteiniborus sp. DW1]SCG84330.1 phosphatidylserine decarboxylase [Proteiniborus sp. DW1]
MKCMDRSGNTIKQNNVQNKIVKFLYKNKFGRVLLNQLIKPWVSNISGVILNSSFSRILIPLFIKIYKINIEEYEERVYTSYNDFFTRKIKEDQRKIAYLPNHLISPCDGKLSVYHITQNSHFIIKNTPYTLKSLLKNKELADDYEDGTLLLFRLTVDDYHRYCYIDNGEKSKNYRIKGVFHTVNPVANEVVPIYKENTREYTILHSENFGKILIVEVGAMLVGKIVNYHEEASVKRGEEKGRFEFGGSTIIVCFEKGRIVIDKDILCNSLNGIETLVKMGEKIGNTVV